MSDIKKMRKQKHITQKQLAEALDINPTLISQYENGKKVPSEERLQVIKDYLNNRPEVKASIDYVIETKNPKRTIVIEKHSPKRPVFRPQPTDNRCALCKKEAPFTSKSGLPYLEAHFIIPLSEGGNPTPDNVVFLCPNCNRKLAILNDPEDRKKLQQYNKNNR